MLEKEIETYEKHLPSLLKTELNKWILIQGEEIYGTYVDEMEALRGGYQRFGREAFLMRRVLPEQPTIFIGGGSPAYR